MSEHMHLKVRRGFMHQEGQMETGQLVMMMTVMRTVMTVMMTMTPQLACHAGSVPVLLEASGSAVWKWTPGSRILLGRTLALPSITWDCTHLRVSCF